MAIEQAMSGRLTRWIAAEPDWDEVYSEQLPRVYNSFRYRFGNIPEVDGQIVSVRVPPVVMVRYEHGRGRTRLFQAQSPEVTLPVGVDPRSLGEIGLRILGLPREVARRFAQVIDWNTTLLVPVPPTAASFRQVDVAGSQGIAIEHHPPNESRTNLVLWSSDGRVYGLASIRGMPDALAMASSVR